MNTLKQLAKDIKEWYDKTQPDFLTEEGMNELYDHLNDIGDYEEMCKEDYIDPSELGGCCGGHWADENMVPMEDEDYEKDEI